MNYKGSGYVVGLMIGFCEHGNPFVYA